MPSSSASKTLQLGDFIRLNTPEMAPFGIDDGRVYKIIGISATSIWDLDCITEQGVKFYANKDFYSKIELSPLERILHGFGDE